MHKNHKFGLMKLSNRDNGIPELFSPKRYMSSPREHSIFQATVNSYFKLDRPKPTQNKLRIIDTAPHTKTVILFKQWPNIKPKLVKKKLKSKKKVKSKLKKKKPFIHISKYDKSSKKVVIDNETLKTLCKPSHSLVYFTYF